MKKFKGICWALMFPVLLFGSAGSIWWAQAWIFLCITYSFVFMLWRYLKQRDPALLKELVSFRLSEEYRKFNRVFVWIYWPMFILRLPVMGFDAVRYGWTDMPLWGEVLGGALLIVSLGLLLSVFESNTFLSTGIKIQADRKHRVIDTGPYSLVRHPMYSSFSLLLVGSAFLLGSFVGVAISLLMVALLAMRSIVEEKTLKVDLVGYDAYCDKVSYRFLPGIW